jgi:hypothetical protein
MENIVDFAIQYIMLLLLLYTLAFFVTGKKNVWGLADPLHLVNIGMAINVANIMFASPSFNIDCIYFLTSFLSFFLFLRAGVVFGRRSSDMKRMISFFRLAKNPSLLEAKCLLIYSIILGGIFYGFFFSKVGFGLLTGDATPDMKLSIFLDGNGVFKYFQWISNAVFLPVFVFLLVRGGSKIVIACGVAWFLFVNIVFGISKSGFVLTIFDLGIMAYYLHARYRITFFSRKWMMAFIIVGMIPAFISLSFYAGAHDQSITEFLTERIIDTGGGSYAYFVMGAKNAFVSLSFIDRLTYYFDTLLSFSRIKEWADPNITAMITQYVTGGYQVGFGQNPYLFLNGHFLFGYFGGFLYVSFLGFLFGIVRASTSLNFLAYYILVKMVTFSLADPDMVQALLISTLLLIPFFFFCATAIKSRKNNIFYLKPNV